MTEAVPPPLVEKLDTAIKDRKFQEAYDACRDDKAPQVLLRLGEMANQPVKPTAAGFFRAGQAGGWKTALSDEERETVESIAGELLRELGYETTPLPQIQQ